MTDYNKATDFAAKDALTSGDPDKIVKGTPIDNEFNAIAVAVATKADRAGPTFTGTITADVINANTLTGDGAGVTDVDAVTLGGLFPTQYLLSTTDEFTGTLTVTGANVVTGDVQAATFTGNGAAITNVDAVTLDTLDSTAFLRSDVADTVAGALTYTASVVLNDSVTLGFGTLAADATMYSDGTNTKLDLASGEFSVRDSVNAEILVCQADGDVDVANDLLIAGTALTTGFTRFRSLTQATYDGLTPDADTIYLIVG